MAFWSLRVRRVIASTRIYEKVSERTEVQVKQIRLRSSLVGVNRGAECAFTVQYLERDSSDPNLMTFMLKMPPAKVVGQVPAEKAEEGT